MNIAKNKLIEFTNLVNECCAVMDDDYVADWLTKPNPDLNMDAPIDIFNQECVSMPKEVTYNPYKYDSFVDGSTYQPVKKSKWARLIKKGNDKPRIFSYE